MAAPPVAAIAPFVWIAVVALLYLLIDAYIIVKCFGASLATFSFWVLWIVYTFLSSIAYGFLKIAAGDTISSTVTPQFAQPTLILLAVLGTVGVVQNLTLRIGDIKFVDLGKFLDGFRSQVLENIAKKSAVGDRLSTMKVADDLWARYRYDLDKLRNEYAAIMTSMGRSLPEIHQELLQLEQETTAAKLSFGISLARRIAQVDLDRAKQLLRN